MFFDRQKYVLSTYKVGRFILMYVSPMHRKVKQYKKGIIVYTFYVYIFHKYIDGVKKQLLHMDKNIVNYKL